MRCAAEIQRAKTDRNSDLPEERRLRFRIGVDLGDVIADRDDHIGDRLLYVFEDMDEQNSQEVDGIKSWS